MSSRRPLHPACGTVVYAQSSGPPHSSQSRPGSWIAGFSSTPPASITQHARPRVDQTAGDDGTAAARADHDHVERIRHRPILRRGNQLLPDDILLGCMGASGTAHDVEHDQREVRPESGPDDRRDHGEEPGAGLIAEPGTDERAGQ